MEGSEEKREVVQALDRYLTLSDINRYSLSKLPEYVKSLVKNKEEFQEFMSQPYEQLSKVGIEPDEVDIDTLTKFVAFAYYKHNDEGVEVLGSEKGIDSQSTDTTRDKLGATMNKKETNEGSHVNWDNSSHSWAEVESNVYSSGKRTSQKTKHSDSYKNKNMEVNGKGIRILPENFLRPEITHLYFPSQPLVTPELIEKIKRLID